MVRLALALGVWLLLGGGAVRAQDMDLELSRLRLRVGTPACAAASNGRAYCPDNEAFERLVTELATTLAPAVTTAAATAGPSGFFAGVSASATSVSAGERYWARGTVGSGADGTYNPSPAQLLLWNRLEARKGLPMGFEVGAGVGQGLATSLWVFSAQIKWALLEGLRSGIGVAPDVAVRGVLQSAFGGQQLRLQTHALDVTLSKPFVIAERVRVSPFLASQVVFVEAGTGRVDLTASGTQASWDACAPSPRGGTGTLASCSGTDADAANTVTFAAVSHTRVRLFVGAEAQKEWLQGGLSVGFDLASPRPKASTPGAPDQSGLARQLAVQLALGVRY